MTLLQAKIGRLTTMVDGLTQNVYVPHKTDMIDRALSSYINNYPERKKLKIMFLRVSEGVYQFGSKKVYIKIEKCGQIFVRVGGGYLPVKDFIDQYTEDEIDKLQRRDAFTRFNNHLQVQQIAHTKSCHSVERDPISDKQCLVRPHITETIPNYTAADIIPINERSKIVIKSTARAAEFRPTKFKHTSTEKLRAREPGTATATKSTEMTESDFQSAFKPSTHKRSVEKAGWNVKAS